MENSIITLKYAETLFPKKIQKYLENDLIFDASKDQIDSQFVENYCALLYTVKQKDFSRVLVVNSSAMGLFPEGCNVVPTLQEAEDLIEMERIERDLGF